MREIRVEGDVAYVPLTKGYEAVIDAADVPLVGGHAWHAKEHFDRNGKLKVVYAARNTTIAPGRQKTLRMHREILGAPEDLEIDHRDSNGLNNRRQNLRPATEAENIRNARLRRDNKSGVKGLSWVSRDKVWRTCVYADGKVAFVRYFKCRSAAEQALAEARTRLHGDFARHA